MTVGTYEEPGSGLSKAGLGGEWERVKFTHNPAFSKPSRPSPLGSTKGVSEPELRIAEVEDQSSVTLSCGWWVSARMVHDLHVLLELFLARSHPLLLRRRHCANVASRSRQWYCWFYSQRERLSSSFP